SPKKLELESYMKFFQGGRCNATLGGACYIHLTMGTNAVFSGFFSLFGHGDQLYELNHFRDELSLSYLF
uniref:hypothetical protein n=1 Tax=uncultured Clostridium sp. TaxID=59620 RepID=UPI00259AA0D2